MTRALGIALCFGLLATACAGLAGGTSGHRVVVRLYDAETDVLLELANDSHPELHDVYSQRRADAALKLAPDELMDELVASIEHVRFRELATEGAAPAIEEAPIRGLRGWVSISQNGEDATFLVPSGQPSAEQLQAFSRMKLVINEYYSRLGGLQYIQNPKGKNVFEPSP
ncbi:MAG: hypothetical protein ACYTG2_14845 [Planctomycetota bacterium]